MFDSCRTLANVQCLTLVALLQIYTWIKCKSCKL